MTSCLLNAVVLAFFGTLPFGKFSRKGAHKDKGTSNVPCGLLIFLMSMVCFLLKCLRYKQVNFFIRNKLLSSRFLCIQLLANSLGYTAT